MQASISYAKQDGTTTFGDARIGIYSFRRPKRQWVFPDSGDERARAPNFLQSSIEKREAAVISLAIGILITIVIGAILFWAIDRFCPDRRLAQLLKLLVVLVCLGSIVSRLLPMLGYPSVL